MKWCNKYNYLKNELKFKKIIHSLYYKIYYKHTLKCLSSENIA
jgi:hypothetical protein